MATKPKPDEYGRIRVRDNDTGHELTIAAGQEHLGDFEVLNEPASTATGDPVPPTHKSSASVETTTTGRTADTKKEKPNG